MVANNLPGFTAAASVYQTRGQYWLATGRAGGVVSPLGREILPQLGRNDLPGASCGKDPVLGNVICVECTSGPSPSCKTYVCDQQGNNCKQTVRLTQPLTASLSATANSGLLARR